MRFRDKLYLVFEPRATVARREVDKAARRLGLTWPDGYAEYVGELGDGILSNNLRIWIPSRIESELKSQRDALTDCFSWANDGPLRRADMQRSVTIGNTMVGDTLVVDPDRPGSIFVLPRSDDEIRDIRPGLEEAIAFVCESGVLTSPTRLRYFEPAVRRTEIHRTIRRPYATVRDAVLALSLHTHIAWEEPEPGAEKVFDVYVERGGHLEEVDEEEESIQLLIQEFGGGVMISAGGPVDPGTTEVLIESVDGGPHPKLTRLLQCLTELENQGKSWWRRFF